MKDSIPVGADTGYRYASAVSEADGKEATLGKDYVFVNGTESFVTVSILCCDPKSGKLISGISGIRVNYRVGCLTTVRGDFLTAGTGGVDIDTSWGDDFNVDFN